MPYNPFAQFSPTAAVHFKLYFYAAVLQLLDRVFQGLGSQEEALERFPFLIDYNDELAEAGIEGLSSNEAIAWWLDALHIWEQSVNVHLPLRAIRDTAHLDDAALLLLIVIGLIEEDTRFGLVFETLQGIAGQHRPTQSLINAWWHEEEGRTTARSQLRRLQELGMIRPLNPDAPRLEQVMEVPIALWEALRGEQYEHPAAWARYRPMDQLSPLGDLILSDELQAHWTKLPEVLASGQVQAVIIRGAQHNGRRTLLGGIARTLGQGVLEVNRPNGGDDARWQLIGPLATALHALPVLIFELAPQETVHVPRLDAYEGVLGIALSKQGGVSGAGVERALTCTIEMPEARARRAHWQRACGKDRIEDAELIGERFRMTSGNIHRTASLAQAYAALAGKPRITLGDVQQAARAVNRQTLDTLAMRLETFGDWEQLAVGAETRRELDNLERRCRHREHLRETVGDALRSQLNPGVRALLTGPSGTGKTLAARLLAAALQMDLYRLDLSTVVNKYIGETEKNLNQIFSRAEELDVILLLDEGDALLTQRTSVQTSNDRYANLETNFLLQRLESFEGILIVTTNAGERIDSAFQRRMDVVIPFHPPDIEERWAIWQLHLPAAHAIHHAFLEQVAQRCEMSGGQIRNAALHASLLALDDGGIVNLSCLEAAIQREYRKAGGVCPLRHFATSA